MTTLIFIVSLSSFDQKMDENISVNRMVESLVLFDGICNNEILYKIPVILFLNKMDLFKIKLEKSKVGHYFLDYQGARSKWIR